MSRVVDEITGRKLTAIKRTTIETVRAGISGLWDMYGDELSTSPWKDAPNDYLSEAYFHSFAGIVVMSALGLVQEARSETAVAALLMLASTPFVWSQAAAGVWCG